MICGHCGAMRAAQHPNCEHSDDDQWDDLDQRCHELDASAAANAEAVYEGEDPDHRNCRSSTGTGRACELRHEHGQVAHCGNGDSRVADPDGKPVAPCDDECRWAAECLFDVGVRPS